MKPWWQVLGVARGSDRATIRRAYAAKLKTTNPEDDAKAFIALREAYEAALRWVEYDYGWDDEEDADADADAQPVSEAPPVGAVVIPVPADPPPTEAVAEPAFIPLPPEAAPSPPADDPAEQARIAEAAELERLKAALEAGLRGPWFKDRPGLIAAFEALMAAPALMEIDRRDRLEYWLAALIADTIPRSDAILKQAMAAFGWEAEGNHPPAVWQVRARLDEWRMIAGFQGDQHPLHAGWRALTLGNVPAWRRRLGALRPGVTDQVRQLFDLAEYDLPGIAHSFEPRAADWWRVYLERPHFGFVELLLLALGALGALLFALAGATPALRIGGAIATGAVGVGFALLHWRVVAPMHWRRAHAGGEVVRGFGWRFGLWLVTVVTFIGAPMTPWIAGGAILLAVASAIAILLLDAGEHDGGEVPWKRTVGLGLLGALSAAGFMAMAAAEQAALLAFFATCGVIGICAPTAIGRLIAPRPILIATVGTLVLLGGAVLRGDIGAAGSSLLYWGAAGGTGLLLMSGLRTRDPKGREGAVADLIGWGLWIILVFAAVLSAPDGKRDNLAPPVQVVPVSPMAALEEREPGFREVKTGNPELYVQVKAIRDAIADGTRKHVEGARAIDALVNAAYRARLPFAPAPLIAAEMDIRLAQLREWRAGDPRSCSGEDRGEAAASLSRALQRRHYAHALRVAASAPMRGDELGRGREIPAADLVRSAANGDAAAARRIQAAMEGTDPSAKCAARIAILEALVAQSDADIARTMRPALIARAEPKSVKK
ncbi:J domain-containing protein [Sphingomonas suaedae]|uniref:J domain-containing protein n=1 Tax=Sphingomonas suaedae TaxID=2599297 RepID=A0A518RJK2_9SPHN|nr:J domain-containing protein [Sphingomonas suaedae]QDX27623.1 J domain-containing protein [Sphingomonas suaedae]